MLRWRLILGTLFIAALVVLCRLDGTAPRPGTYLLPLALIVGCVGASELLGMFNKRGHAPIPWVVYVGVSIAILLAGLRAVCPPAVQAQLPGSLGWMAIGLAMGLLLAFIGEVLRFDGRRQSTVNLALEAFTILYLGGALGFIAQLRQLGSGASSTDARSG